MTKPTSQNLHCSDDGYLPFCGCHRALLLVTANVDETKNYVEPNPFGGPKLYSAHKKRGVFDPSVHGVPADRSERISIPFVASEVTPKSLNKLNKIR